MAKVMDRETLQFIMRSMTTNNRELQRRVAEQYLTDDVKLTHFLGDVQGRDALYGVYRAAVTGLDYKLQFLEMVVDHHMAACWVDLNIKLAPFYIKRYHMPTIVMTRFRTCEDGLIRICEQVDHHSIFVFMWALGWPFSAVWDLVFRRFTGTLLSTSGWAIDTAEDATRAALSASLKSSGWLMGQFLPPTLLDSITQALPEGLVQQLGLSGSGAAAGGLKPAVGEAAGRVWEDVRSGVNAAAATVAGDWQSKLLPVSSSSSSSGVAAGNGSTTAAAAAAAPASSNAGSLDGWKPQVPHDGPTAASVKADPAALLAAEGSLLSSTVAGGSYQAATGSGSSNDGAGNVASAVVSARGLEAAVPPSAVPLGSGAADGGAAGSSKAKTAAAPVAAAAPAAAAPSMSGPGSKSGKRKKKH